MKDKLVYLKDQLNNLSKSNRSIRMLKLYDKWAFDLSQLNRLEQKDPRSVVESVTQRKGNKLLLKRDINNNVALTLSKKLTTLYRNINSIEEETGMYDLHLGFPYITGCALDGTYIRAPLFLYPVRLTRDKSNGLKWKLQVEETEPQLNRTLFLALKKMNDFDVDEAIYSESEDIAKSIDFSQWISWLKKYDFHVHEPDQNELQSFQDYRKDTLPDIQKGTFTLENMAILGHFPQGDSSLLKDYETMIEHAEQESSDFGLAQDFLKVGEDDEEEKQATEESLDLEQERTEETKEREKFFVLDADASQEDIVKDLKQNQKGMVVHGPPGTGKSQVIVNLIADAAAQNKKVLLVCQKRAALDVVYQRLEGLGLSDHAAMLQDEKKDRKNLYGKIKNLLDQPKDIDEYEQELQDVSEKIEEHEAYLNEVAKGLYEVQEHGFKAFDLYSKAKSYFNQENILPINAELPSLSRKNLDDVLANIYTYGDFYSRFGGDNYALKNRKSFAGLELKDQVTMKEILENIIEKAEESARYLEELEQNMTPEYSWNIQEKLEKISDDLSTTEKKTLQKFRLWWWTSFTGKTIVEELLEGEKFNGLSSKEWPQLRESLRILYELSQVSETMSQELRSLEKYFKKNEIDDLNQRVAKGDIPIQALNRLKEHVIEDFENLRSMDHTYQQSPDFIQSLIEKLKEKTATKNPADDLAAEWVDLVKQSAYIYWIDEIERKHPKLTTVETGEFQRRKDDLKALLQKKASLTAKVLMGRLNKTLHQNLETNNKKMKSLKYQAGKKKKVWPVRQLVREFAQDGLINVMPIWLTSPETVSAIFPLQEELFDIVIFDEASQCTVENGIPSIYRGKQVVIAGDEKQLPPFKGFRATVGNEDEEEEDEEPTALAESESLLGHGKRFLPEKLLQWHYRSKSEELINFSNHAFYNGTIQTAPNVSRLKDPAAIQWHKVDGRWINQHNEVEANAVVNLLKQTLTTYLDKSIGIITFNAKQQDKILDFIENEAEQDLEFGKAYQQVMAREVDERIFVKNIENVQGDERDIVIFSIAYARNEEGRVYKRFGTLGQQGGENRLNVAVSRAKEQVHVVASIEPYELDVTTTKNEGPRLLKSYMAYAKAVSNVDTEEIDAVLSELNEDRNTRRQERTDLWFDSPFEDQVYHALTEIGYEVDTQVGMSGYRIDLAIAHPKDPQRYIIGIECDGATYHSAPSAKERDVYRQQFLESKGWTITRIWSRNWWKNQSAEIERIDQWIREKLREEGAKKKVVQMGS